MFEHQKPEKKSSPLSTKTSIPKTSPFSPGNSSSHKQNNSRSPVSSPFSPSHRKRNSFSPEAQPRIIKGIVVNCQNLVSFDIGIHLNEDEILKYEKCIHGEVSYRILDQESLEQGPIIKIPCCRVRLNDVSVITDSLETPAGKKSMEIALIKIKQKLMYSGFLVKCIIKSMVNYNRILVNMIDIITDESYTSFLLNGFQNIVTPYYTKRLSERRRSRSNPSTEDIDEVSVVTEKKRNWEDLGDRRKRAGSSSSSENPVTILKREDGSKDPSGIKLSSTPPM